MNWYIDPDDYPAVGITLGGQVTFRGIYGQVTFGGKGQNLSLRVILNSHSGQEFHVTENKPKNFH